MCSYHVAVAILKWVTIFFVTFSGIGCDDFHKLFTENTNEYANSTEMAINYLIKNISARDIRIVATESVFDRNYISKKWKHNASFTLLNIERQFNVNGTRKYPITAVVVLFLDLHQLVNDDLTQLWQRFKRNKVIATANRCLDLQTVTDYFALSWSVHFLNFILLNSCDSTVVDVYTYFPFANNQCRIFASSNIKRIGSFLINTSTPKGWTNVLQRIQFYVKKKSEIFFDYMFPTSPLSGKLLPFFPNKIPLNLNRCPVKIITGIWPPNVINISSIDEAGIEVEFIKTMEQRLNCNLSVHVDDQIGMGLQFDENKEPTGRMGLLKNQKYDLLFGAVPATPNVFKDFDMTDWFLPNQLKFIVPAAGRLPSSMILWTVFEKNTTLLCIVLIVVLLQSILIKYMHRLSFKQSVSIQNGMWFIVETFATLLRSLIETSTPMLPDSKAIKFVYGIWFGSCLIISCLFTTTLTSFFAEPGHVVQLKTVSDIIRSKIPLSISELYYPVLSNDAEQLKYLLSVNVNQSVPIGLKLASMGQAATFTDVLRARYISVQWVSWYGDSSIYYIRGDQTKSYWNVMVSYKGNPLIHRINDVMKRFNECGLWNFQIDKYYNRRLIRTMIRQYLIVYNFQNNINNTNSINQFNEGFTDSFSSMASATGSEKLLLETNEDDILKRFAKSEKTLITWDHLSAVFQVWFVGMATAGLTFVGEVLTNRCVLRKNRGRQIFANS